MEDFNSKYSGEQVEALLDQVASGNAGGGGGITEEADPIFSASPAASITDADKVAWNNKVDYANKSLSIVGADGFMTSEGEGFVLPNTPAAQGEHGLVLATLDDIPDELTESDIAAMGFTKNTGTYSKPSGGIPKSDLASDVQTSLGKADNSLQVEKFQEMDIVTVNGLAGGKSGLVCALPHESIGEEDDVLLSRNTVKTINGESIVGSGNIEISGGSGEVGPQGPKGDKGDKGDTGATGVGVQSVKQTTISNTDGGSNVVTVTLTNGTTSTFTVKNGSKGSSGSNGTNGKDGKDGADGATFTPSVDSAGNLSWTNNKGLTNPPTVNIKGPKGDAGEGGGSTEGEGVIQWTMRYAPDYTNEDGVISLDPFVVYYSGCFSGDGTILFNGDNDYNEWRIIFYIGAGNSLTINIDNWANGIIPDISAGGIYELSVVDNGGGLFGVMAQFHVG